MLNDVLPVFQRPEQPCQFAAVALTDMLVAQDERMATEFMEGHFLMSKKFMPGRHGYYQGISPDWLRYDALADIRSVRQADHEVARAQAPQLVCQWNFRQA